MLHVIVSQASPLLRQLASHGARESGRQTDRQTDRHEGGRRESTQDKEREALEGESKTLEGEAYRLLNLKTVELEYCHELSVNFSYMARGMTT